MSNPLVVITTGPRWRSVRLAAVTVLSLAALGITSAATAAASGTVTVACGDVNGPHGLIAEINAANTPSGPRVITLAENCVYTLTQARTALSSAADHDGLPPVTGRLTILGQGAEIQRRIAGAGVPAFRVIEVGPTGQLRLNSVVVRGGLDLQGGGIYTQQGGVLNLVSSKLVQNTASGGDGGGLLNNGTASITNNSTVSVNNVLGSENQAGAFGGGIENDGTLTMSNSLVSFNRANALSSSRGQAEGGAISNFGSMTLTGVMMQSNTAESDVAGGLAAGGAIESDPFGTPPFGAPASTTLNRTIVSSNSATDPAGGAVRGGGIVVERGTLTLHGGSVSDNTASNAGASTAAGGGIYLTAGTVRLNQNASVTANQPNNCQPTGSIPGCTG